MQRRGEVKFSGLEGQVGHGTARGGGLDGPRPDRAGLIHLGSLLPIPSAGPWPEA